MLFTNEQRRRIGLGEITTTVRAWQRAQVTAGRRYRWDDEKDLVVTSVDVVEPGAISSDDAIASGYPSREALLEELGRIAPDRVGGPLYRVRFTLEPRRVPPPASDAEIATLVARLKRLDGASDHGPWTRDALTVIAANPRVVSTELAAQVGRERFAFKADVRKLKRLGLTRSHEVGYEVTPLGLLVLAALGASSSGARTEASQETGE